MPGSGRLPDLILFTYLSNTKRPTYQGILNFLASFGITTEMGVKTLINKLKDGDVVYSGIGDERYRNLLEALINSPEFGYPLTKKFAEAFKMFKNLGIQHGDEFKNFITKVARDHPEFLTVSSSRVGEPPDLITFKQLFSNDVLFELRKNWVL